MADALERFTERTREALQRAAEMAARMGSGSLDVEHLLAALLEDDSSIGAQVVRAAGGDLVAIRADLRGVARHLRATPRRSASTGAPVRCWSAPAARRRPRATSTSAPST